MPDDENNIEATIPVGKVVGEVDVPTGAVHVSAEDLAGETGVMPKPIKGSPDLGHFHPGHVSIGASSSEVVEMDSAKLRLAAEAGESTITGLIETLEELKGAVAQTADGWNSPGGDYFREVFATRIGRFERALEELGTYPGELIAFADDYEGISSRMTTMAEDVASAVETVQSANWSSVTGG